MVIKIFDNIVSRNAIGILALISVHFLADRANLVQRSGLQKGSPYLFVILLYGWIVFHNRVLFEKLYLRDRKRAYFGWTALAMLLSSLNMHYILITGFGVKDTMPHIVSFWIYTVAGLGVYVIWRYKGRLREGQKIPTADPNENSRRPTRQRFICNVNGMRHEILYSEIQYIESMENYIRINMNKRQLIVRQPLKEAEEQLSSPPFIRISRSCIVNRQHITGIDGETMRIAGKEVKVGKVFKKYVEKLMGEELS